MTTNKSQRARQRGKEAEFDAVLKELRVENQSFVARICARHHWPTKSVGQPDARTEKQTPTKIYIPTFRLRTFAVDLVREPASRFQKEKLSDADRVEPVARAIYRKLDADKEHFAVLALNNKNWLNGFKTISTGSMTASLAHPREIFRAAISLAAAGVIFIHNHPSGDPEPSADDIDTTRRLTQSAEILGLRVLDHMILGDDKYFSFNERGML